MASAMALASTGSAASASAIQAENSAQGSDDNVKSCGWTGSPPGSPSLNRSMAIFVPVAAGSGGTDVGQHTRRTPFLS
ncbi:hypothetical protein GCM10008965_33060 [Methylorubrum aminovorans]